MVMLSMSLNSPMSWPSKAAQMSATKICARLRMRSEDFEEKECVSLKQENEEARVLTSCEAEREEDSIKAVGEQENF